MFAGPVCHFELVRIARHRRTFALRFVFGLCILGAVGVSGYAHSGPARPWSDPGRLTIGEASRLAESVFGATMGALAVLVVGLTPGLVADAIAADRQGKTLHDLLASQLTSAEIVAGKLAARLINVGVFALLVLPIVSLMTLLGGVSPLALVLTYAALAATAYFLASLALLVSVLAKRARDAVGAAYTLTAAWLFVPPLLQSLVPELSAPWSDILRSLLAVTGWVGPPTLLSLGYGGWNALGGDPARLTAHVLRLTGMLAAYGTLFVALAAWQLRPAFRRQEGRAGRVSRRGRRWFAIRPCSDDPVYWKEAHFSVRAGGLARNCARLASYGILGAVMVGFLYGSVSAFQELSANGYGFGGYVPYSNRMKLNMALRVATGVLFVLWMLWLGGIAAAGLASEREQDTWISLLATPLDAGEILRGKTLGPLRATGHCGAVILALWLLGLAAGAVHPLGLINALVVLGLYTWFILAVGTFASLRSPSTWQARLWTQSVLVAPHLCCLVPLPSAGHLLGVSLWSYSEIDSLAVSGLPIGGTFFWITVAWFVGGTLFYGVVAYVLTVALPTAFDAAAGRPNRDGQPAPARWRAVLKKDRRADPLE